MSEKRLEQEIDEALAKQLTWRRIMSCSYFVTSAVAIAASGSATVFAGLGQSATAAACAGTATVLFGIEKAMLFREKWAHHLRTSAQLEALRLEYLHAGLEDDEAARLMGEIASEYAVGLPMIRRDAGKN